jgi:hypothetical protein
MCFMIRVGGKAGVFLYFFEQISSEMGFEFELTMKTFTYENERMEWLAKHKGTVRWLWPTASTLNVER